jgi:hypothetical protein
VTIYSWTIVAGDVPWTIEISYIDPSNPDDDEPVKLTFYPDAPPMTDYQQIWEMSLSEAEARALALALVKACDPLPPRPEDLLKGA